MKFKLTKEKKKAVAKKLKEEKKTDKEYEELCKLLEAVVTSWKK